MTGILFPGLTLLQYAHGDVEGRCTLANQGRMFSRDGSGDARAVDPHDELTPEYRGDGRAKREPNLYVVVEGRDLAREDQGADARVLQEGLVHHLAHEHVSTLAHVLEAFGIDRISPDGHRFAGEIDAVPESGEDRRMVHRTVGVGTRAGAGQQEGRGQALR